jgi:hypothetical protein
MRRAVAIVSCVAAIALTRSAAVAGLPKRFDVRATAIAFYPAASLLAADGNVHVRSGNRTIDADHVRIDLQKNRILATGNVRVHSATHDLKAAVYAFDPAQDRATLIEIGDTTSATLLVQGDADPILGKAAPGTFETPDVGGVRPYIKTRHAVVTPNANVRFTPALFPTGIGKDVPSPSYMYTFVSNSSFSQSSLPPVSFDQPYGLFGTPNSLLAAHLRLDAHGGSGVALDEHLVDSDRAYLVTSFIPTGGTRTDLTSFQKMNKFLNQTLNGTYERDYGQLAYAINDTGKLFATKEAISIGNGDFVDDVSVTTFDHEVKHLIAYRMSADYGYDHFPSQLPFVDDFRTTLNAFLSTPSGWHGPLHTDLTVNYTVQSTTYSYPHQLFSGTVLGSLSKSLKNGLNLNVSASFAQIASRYADSLKYVLGLPNPADPYYAPDGTLYPGYFAYQGIGTQRTYALAGSYAPNPRLNTQFSLTYADDFPQFHGLGRPPLSAFLDVRFPIAANLSLEYGRTYVFGWGGQRFTPYYTLTVLQQ